MNARWKTVRRLFCPILGGLLLSAAAAAWAQTPKPAPAYPARLPYSFGNFVWWSDDELRSLLKKRIPGLGDEIATTTAAEGRVRDALKALLKEKGITAEVQSQEPSYSSFGVLRDPEASPTSIEFSILDPQILLDKVVLQMVPEELVPEVQSEGPWAEGRPYSALGDWSIRSRIKRVLHARGYLDAQVQISRQPPRKDGDRYQVVLEVAVNAGPVFHISSIAADGGPLFEGRNLSQYFTVKPGDAAGPPVFGGLGAELAAFYRHSGYADVDVEVQPTLDREHALVAYRLDVIPGPVYHLRSVAIKNLDAPQENRVRELLGMKPGDVFLDEAVNGLYRKIADDPLLKGYRFSFGPKRDKTANAIDLSLDFFKNGNESKVTIK